MFILITSTAPNPPKRSSGGGVQSVTGNIVDNTDPINPVVTQVQPDWNAVSGLAEILNKPSIPAAGANTALSNLASVSINAALEAQAAKDLGSTSKPFRDLFIYGAGTYGTTSLKLTGTPTGARVLTIPDATDTLALLAAVQTLTNKRITQRVVTTTDDATAVIDVAVTDVYELSAIANNTTFSFTGTPTDGQKFIIRYKDAGVQKNLTWTGFVAIGITLPSTTTAGKWGYVGVTWNAAAGAYHAIAEGTQA